MRVADYGDDSDGDDDGDNDDDGDDDDDDDADDWYCNSGGPCRRGRSDAM